MFKILKKPNIEFLCQEEDWDIIPKPFPARKLIPEWYKNLQPKTGTKGLESSTIKRCPPFLDAMQLGWIIPLAGDVEFISNNDASGVDYKWHFYKPLVENHGIHQLSGEKVKHPSFPKPPMKFLNYWSIKVPEGYSVLFTPPFNRIDPRFQCITGVVDCDKYFEFINFPFFFNEPNFSGIIEAGTPLVQVIPFKRDTFLEDSEIRSFSEKDIFELEKTRKRRKSHESYYRDSLHVRK